jgi:hypothetical protein
MPPYALPRATHRCDLSTIRALHDNVSSAQPGLNQTSLLQGEWMKFKFFTAIIMLACFAHAKEPKPRQTGTLLQMDSAECSVDERAVRLSPARCWARSKLIRRSGLDCLSRRTI